MRYFLVAMNYIRVILSNKAIVIVFGICQIFCYFIILLCFCLGMGMSTSVEYRTYVFNSQHHSDEIFDSISLLKEIEGVDNIIVECEDNIVAGVKDKVLDVVTGSLIDNKTTDNTIIMPIEYETYYSINDIIKLYEKDYIVVGFSNSSFVEINYNSIIYVARVERVNVITSDLPNKSIERQIESSNITTNYEMIKPPKIRLISVARSNIISLSIILAGILSVSSIYTCFQYLFLRQKNMIDTIKYLGANRYDISIIELLSLFLIFVFISAIGSLLFYFSSITIFKNIIVENFGGFFLRYGNYITISILYFVIIIIPFISANIKSSNDFYSMRLR